MNQELKKQVQKLRKLLETAIDSGTSGVISLTHYDFKAFQALKEEVKDRITVNYDQKKNQIHFKVNKELNNRSPSNPEAGYLLIPEVLPEDEWERMAQKDLERQQELYGLQKPQKQEKKSNNSQTKTKPKKHFSQRVKGE